jgi:acyl carrier protein
MDDLHRALAEILADLEILPASALDDRMSLKNDLGLTSLKLVAVLASLAQRCRFSASLLSELDVPAMTTVGDMLGMIAKLRTTS